MTKNGALAALKVARQYLTAQQYRTMRGQVLAGDIDGAMSGLYRIMKKLSDSRL